MFAALLPLLSTVFGTVAKSIFPDPADQLKAQELQNQLQMALIQQAGAIEAAAAANVNAEIKGESWLQRNWRPIMMLTFAGLIVARWFGYAAPNMQPDEYLALWDIVKIGLGGYVVGRSVEKIAPSIASAIKK